MARFKTASLNSKSASTGSRPPHHVDSSKSLFTNPWQTQEESQATDDESINQRAQNTNASNEGGGGTLEWLWNIPSMIANIPIELARELTGHAQRPVKVVKPDFVGKASTSTSDADLRLRATWLGHASYLVEMPVTYRIIFDPIFSDRAGPSAWTGIRRRLPPPCTIDELPDIHYVFISHNHYDHLDLPSIQSLCKRGTNIEFLVPLGLASWLTSGGIPAQQIHELDWWQDISLPPRSTSTTDSPSTTSLKVTCTPAQHTSGRNVMDRNSTLWCGWAIKQVFTRSDGSSGSANVYHVGDSGYMTSRGPCKAFKDIGERLGPFDLAMIPIWRGGTLGFISQMGLRLTHHPALSALHCTPAEAMCIHADVRSRHSLAMHFATFAGSDAEALEPLVELEYAKRGEPLAASESGSSEDEPKRVPQETGIGDWMEESGFGWIDVGETALIPLDG